MPVSGLPAASRPPQGALLPQTFLLNRTIKAQGGGPTRPPSRALHGAPGSPHLFLHFFSSLSPTISIPFLSTSPFFRNDTIRGI